MNAIGGKVRGGMMGQYLRSTIEAWDRFWFTPSLPHTLAVLRIATGLMLLYSHLVLATDLMAFVGNEAWINNETARELHDGAFGFADWGRSYLVYLDNPLVLWIHHGITIAVTACFAAGFLTRITGPVAWFLQVMYLHRLTGALFGLDQIVTYAAMYLMIAPCGGWLSVDAWIRRRIGDDQRSEKRWLAWLFPDASPSVAANVATRLLQIHLCVIYLFGGLAKARGVSWWDGTAMWYSAGNYEYQSWDLTWIAGYPRLGAFLSQATLFWEVSYIALVWPRLTRPIVLVTAVAVHAGIATFLGMITFGTMMVAANMIFVKPEFLLRMIGRPVIDDVVANHPGDSGDPDDFNDPGDPGDFNDSDAPIASEIEDEAWEDIDLAAEDASASSIGLGSSILSLEGSGAIVGDEADDLSQRAAKLDRHERKLRRAAKTLQEKYERQKQREATYQQRVAKLKEREAKIKSVLDKKRKSKDK